MKYRIKKETKPKLPTFGKYKAVAVHQHTISSDQLIKEACEQNPISEDVMTARFAWFPPETLAEIVRTIAALPFVDALFFDATNKPPATFGWE